MSIKSKRAFVNVNLTLHWPTKFKINAKVNLLDKKDKTRILLIIRKLMKKKKLKVLKYVLTF